METPPRYGSYRVVREISKGGMAQVYLAQDERDGRAVALKVLLPHVADDREFRLRFAHEVQAHKDLRHDNIVTLHEWGEHEGLPFMAMELMDGPTLKRLLTEAKRFPPEVALFMATEVLRGLNHAHGQGVVHRDVKPSNIMLSRDGRVKIADFGIATGEAFTKLTQTGNIIGTPAYMSPEQARGEHADKRTDIFAMGVILYECLVGANPFQSDHPATTLKRVIDGGQTPLFEINPSIPAELEAVVDNMMEKDVLRRYPDAGDVLKDLETVRATRAAPFGAAEMAAFLADARAEAARRDRTEAEAHYQRGIALYREGRGNPDRAIWELYQAVVIEPSHEAARNALEIISQEKGYRLQASDNPDIRALREKLDKDPGNAPVLVQLAKLYKREGNFLQVIRCYVRLRKLHLRDPYLANQMNTLIGVDNLEVFDRTRSLVARRQAPEVVGVTPPSAEPGGPPLALPGPRVKLPPRPFEEKPASETFLKSVLSVPVILALGAVVVVGLVVRALVSGEKAEPLVRPGELAVDLRETVDSLRPPEPSGPGDEATALLGRAASLVKDQPARAEEMSRRFLDKFGDHARRGEAFLLLARSLEAQGKRDESLRASNEGLGVMDTRTRIDAHGFRSRVLQALDRTEDAADELRAIQRLNDPVATPVAQLDLVRLYRKGRDLDKALAEADDLLAFHGKSRQAMDGKLLKAEILIEAGRASEAIPILQGIKRGASIDAPEYRSADRLEAAARASASEEAPAGEEDASEGSAPEPPAEDPGWPAEAAPAEAEPAPPSEGE